MHSKKRCLVIPVSEGTRWFDEKTGKVDVVYASSELDEYGHPRFGGVPREMIRTVALCTGGGAEFLGDAAAAGADVYVTGDVKYHDAQRAKELGILIVDAGHFGTEEGAAPLLAAQIKQYGRKNGFEELPITPFMKQTDFFFA